MPKPLFTRLAAICAVGLFCVLFGGVYALSLKDTILLVMSLLLGVCCIIRFLLLYRTIKTEDYLILEGTCVKREKSHLTRNQQVLFRTADGKEYRFNLEKNTRLLAGHSYRLYFKIERSLEENQGKALHDPALIGYEELMEVAAEE
jgi:hypothetical protein